MTDDRTKALEERIAWLEAKIDGLRAERTPTMRASGRCPGCDGSSVLHFTRVGAPPRDPDGGPYR